MRFIGGGLKVSLLHARGGVSYIYVFSSYVKRSSPRSWRCFLYEINKIIRNVVFSTLVEVFLDKFKQMMANAGLLHARGGVSLFRNTGDNIVLSSPRSWRCFRVQEEAKLASNVFSTLVEVFLRSDDRG